MALIKGIDMYSSDIITDMLFDCEEDAKSFDDILNKYCENKEALAEFDKAERQYASLYAIDYAIQVSKDFHLNLTGPYSDELISKCENMIENINEGCESDDCYILTMLHIFCKLHPNYVSDLP